MAIRRYIIGSDTHPFQGWVDYADTNARLGGER